MRRLIVNADDFGQSLAVNSGIIAAHEGGIVTSASLMVRWPAAAHAAAYVRRATSLDVGLHLDLGEWICRDREWHPLYQVVDADDPKAVSEELTRQLETFRALVGGDPTHLDSHQHIHRDEPTLSVASLMAQQLGVPLRNCSSVIRYCGLFYGQTAEGDAFSEGITTLALSTILRQLPAGITELGCHPGAPGDDLETMYRDERVRETIVLSDPAVRAVIIAEGIELCTFASAATVEAPTKTRETGRKKKRG